MTDTQLSADDTRSLRRLAGLIIPASSEFQVPGADDDAIFADILRSFGRDGPLVATVMDRLRVLAGGVFANLDATRQWDVAAHLRAEGGEALTALQRIVIACYYRDDRVMRSLDMETRPPFPKGFTVEQGDWSLLDPVRARAPFYRKVP